MRTFLALLFLCTIASAQEAPRHLSPEYLRSISREDIDKTKQHAIDLAKGPLLKEIDDAHAETAAFRKAAQDAQAQVLQAKGETSLLQHHIDDLTDWGNEQQAEKQKAEADLIVSEKAKKAAEAHVSSIKTWLGFALGAILALLVQQLPWSFVIPPWNLYGRIAGTALAFGLGWLIVARFV